MSRCRGVSQMFNHFKSQPHPIMPDNSQHERIRCDNHRSRLRPHCQQAGVEHVAANMMAAKAMYAVMLNMRSMSVTLGVSHLQRSPLNEEAYPNMLTMAVTLDMSQPLESPLKLCIFQHERKTMNMPNLPNCDCAWTSVFLRSADPLRCKGEDCHAIHYGEQRTDPTHGHHGCDEALIQDAKIIATSNRQFQYSRDISQDDKQSSQQKTSDEHQRVKSMKRSAGKHTRPDHTDRHNRCKARGNQRQQPFHRPPHHPRKATNGDNNNNNNGARGPDNSQRKQSKQTQC